MSSNFLKRIGRSVRNRILPYVQQSHFIQDWKALSDITLAQKIFEVETFRKNVDPDKINLPAVKRMLVLAPHQDDEVIGAGGTMLKARETGTEVFILYLTDGAGGSVKDAKGEKESPEVTRQIREGEAQAVCNALSARMDCLNINNVSMDITAQHVEHLRTICAEFKPDVILSPWLLDAAPKHRISNHLLHLALKDQNFMPEHIWGYQVNNGIWANSYVDITDFIEKRRELLSFYKSQNEGLRRYDHLADGLAAWNSRVLPSGSDAATQPSYIELFCVLPAAEHNALIEKFYLQDLERTYSPKTILAHKMKALHEELSA